MSGYLSTLVHLASAFLIPLLGSLQTRIDQPFQSQPIRPLNQGHQYQKTERGVLVAFHFSFTLLDANPGAEFIILNTQNPCTFPQVCLLKQSVV